MGTIAMDSTSPPTLPCLSFYPDCFAMTTVPTTTTQIHSTHIRGARHAQLLPKLLRDALYTVQYNLDLSFVEIRDLCHSFYVDPIIPSSIKNLFFPLTLRKMMVV